MKQMCLVLQEGKLLCIVSLAVTSYNADKINFL